MHTPSSSNFTGFFARAIYVCVPAIVGLGMITAMSPLFA